jgi:opacity protein-like surface antigen
MNYIFKALSALLFFLSCAAHVNASESENKRYVSLSYGLAFPNKFIGSDVKNRYDVAKKPKRSNYYNLALGYKILPDIRIELDYSYFQKFEYRARQRITLNLGSDEFEDFYRQNITSHVFMANSYYDFLKYKGFNEYISVGAGYANNRTGQYTARPSDPTAAEVAFTNQGRNTNNLAWSVGAGASYDANQHITIKVLNYRYYDLGKVKSKFESHVSSAPQARLQTHVFSTGLAVNF